MIPAEYALKACAVLVMLWSFFNFAAILFFTGPGVVILFVGALATLTAVSSGATLIAVGFLYPETVLVEDLSGLLWLLIPTSLASVLLYDLVIEGLLLRTLRPLGVGLLAIRITEAIGRSVFTALSLLVVADLLTVADLTVNAALVAGIVSAFVRYYLGLWTSDASFGDDGTTVRLDDVPDSHRME